MRTLNPPGWPRGKGYSHGIEAEGRLVFVSGQVGWDVDMKFRSSRFPDQVRQALQNVKDILAEAKAGPEHVVRMTWYVLDKEEYLASLAEVGAVYREVMGRSFPAMSLVEVKGLVEPGARLEIEATAVVPR
jgi:enamine deaminase RidA (YjgF/YER057c/UK114 family)